MMIDLPNRIKEVSISSFGQHAGRLAQPAEYAFYYESPDCPPCSLNMPLRDAPYNYGELHPVFRQNLPEGYVRRYIAERLERYATVNDLYLLALQRDNGIGHITVESTIVAGNNEQLSLDDILHWRGSKPIFAELLDRYYLSGILSGVQPKVMVPISGRSTIHQNDLIVKTFDDEFEQLTVNEYICMSAAKHVGLNPPNFWLSDDHMSFVIERFDINDGQQLAFEDFTVLTGQPKYRGKYETLMRATWDYTHSQEQMERMYRYIIFNCLIGNGDAHLKNFALQYSQDRQNITLTPPYDITHTLIYPHLDNTMALKMKGAKIFPDRKTLTNFGVPFGLRNGQAIIEEYADLLNDFYQSFDAINLMPGLKDSLRKSLSSAMIYSEGAFRHDKKPKYK
ncbi:MAG: type II toxin-antitoxin system HipA family toxin [Oceanicoccus sp.]|uniref:type II toxin-antitoxin system HipA family toxin n=1 Tax=Oceanicoccus sp. TaxID=2691044 RepID=UPI0026135F4E|nr:type II toxin-antitoxin system HipA family toxin [Oceanicoccus sp.]MDG1772922.1 type II toxin-antitoxin system HipA family toxin [Oceanicoccus sp.]